MNEKHNPGDGVIVFSNGLTSEPCILAQTYQLLSHFSLTSLIDLWNLVYPEEPLTLRDMGKILDSALPRTKSANMSDINVRRAILSDLEEMGRDELVEIIVQEFDTNGIYI